MIWVWLKAALLWLAKLVIPPNAPLPRVIKTDDFCPACGNRSGSIQFVRIADTARSQLGTPMVQHSCKVCKFQWYEETVSVARMPAA